MCRSFSDLLLHNVAAPGVADISDGDAQPNEFRTPPLWGIRATAPYMHDGAAHTLEDAIMLHGGEATDSTAAFEALSDADRAALILYLNSI